MRDRNKAVHIWNVYRLQKTGVYGYEGRGYRHDPVETLREGFELKAGDKWIVVLNAVEDQFSKVYLFKINQTATDLVIKQEKE